MLPLEAEFSDAVVDTVVLSVADKKTISLYTNTVAARSVLTPQGMQ